MKITVSGLLNYIKQSYEDKYGGLHFKCEFSAPEKGSILDMYSIHYTCQLVYITIIFAVAVFSSELCTNVLFLMLDNCRRFKKNRQEHGRIKEKYSYSECSMD